MKPQPAHLQITRLSSTLAFFNASIPNQHLYVDLEISGDTRQLSIGFLHLLHQHIDLEPIVSYQLCVLYALPDDLPLIQICCSISMSLLQFTLSKAFSQSAKSKHSDFFLPEFSRSDANNKIQQMKGITLLLYKVVMMTTKQPPRLFVVS